MTSTAPVSAATESASPELASPAGAALQPGSHVLVTGAAGYVGSVCATVLLEQGYRVTVVDDLSTGNRDAIPEQAEFVEGDIRELAEPVLSVPIFLRSSTSQPAPWLGNPWSNLLHTGTTMW